MHAAIPKLPQEVRNQIAGAVMFGDTKNAQEKGKVRGLDADKFKIFCNANDGVCGGGLNVNNGHFAYAPKVADAVSFLTAAVTKASKGAVAGNGPPSSGGGESSGEEAPSAGKGAKAGKGKTGKGGKGGSRLGSYVMED